MRISPRTLSEPDKHLNRRHRARFATEWRDPKRYLWILGSIVPALVFEAWVLVELTGVRTFWWLGPIFAFGLVPLLDYLAGLDSRNPPEDALVKLEGDRFYRWVTYLYLPIQYLSLVFACVLWADGLTMTTLDRLGLMFTVGIVGGISIGTAHEHGHRRAKVEKRLSKAALAQTCYGHFFVEHNRGHHARVATADDPASSHLGENLYRFIPRSVIGGLQSAWQLERIRLSRLGKPLWHIGNDVLNGWLMSAGLFAALVASFGIVVLPWLIGQAVVGFCLLEAVNYLEHYGLRRQRKPDGRYERVRPCHSWNSNTIIANVVLFHLQRHSDHHAHPTRRYQALRHAEEAPQLPFGYATMLLIAALPPLWRRVMDRRVIEHYGGDIRLAALSERYATGDAALETNGSVKSMTPDLRFRPEH